jgi:hypothetical protein
MSARYYATRRLNPFRGVVQTVEAGDASAHSFDGVTWHLRADDGFGWERPVGVWVEGEGMRAGVGERYPELLEALQAHPALPFKLADSVELWLLDRDQGAPLALIDSTRPSQYRPGPVDAVWQPFVLTYTAFRSAALSGPGETEAGGPVTGDKEVLALIVNEAARPLPRAQWFKRDADGRGEGLAGQRLEAGWQGRRLDAAAFPELLVRETWNNRLEQSVISDYHAWVSPFLLLLPNLSDATRDRLERAAGPRARWLSQVHRLLPKVIDPARMNAALVAARLDAASGTTEQAL